MPHMPKNLRLRARAVAPTQAGPNRGRSASFLHSAAAAAVLLGVGGPTLAAKVDATEFDQLMNEARSKGVVSVLVQLDDAVPLPAMRAQTPAKRAESVAKAARLRAELGVHALDAGHWSNGIGQARFYVTPAGLNMLRASPQAVSVSRDVTAVYSIVVNDLDGSVDEVEAALQQRGRVEVEVVLNVDSADYEIAADAQTRYRPKAHLPAQSAAALKALMAEPFARGIHRVDTSLIDGQGAAPKLRMSVDLEAFLGLKEHLGIRAIRLAGYKDRRKAVWDPEALVAAQRDGSAEVSISLRGSESFSPRSGYMSAQAWAAQEAAHRKAFADILSAAGAPKALDDVKNGIGLGTIGVRLNHAVLDRLFQLSDPRVLAVEANRPMAKPLLSYAMELINAKKGLWDPNYDAAGQNIVIMDSGVYKQHEMFYRSETDKSSRVIMEGCFGSYKDGYGSICPNQLPNGDSPLNYPGSGDPLSIYRCPAEVPACRHGTQVASIAAGRKSANVASGTLQGVAIGANLVSFQVFSWNGTNANAHGDDMQAALEAVKSYTAPGTGNPIVVNMSLGGEAFYSTCTYRHQGVTKAVADLLSLGVPVVAAAGNEGPTNALAFPACVPGVIKVSGVRNSGAGDWTDNKWNYGSPSAFSGPIFLAPGGSSDFVTNVRSADRLHPTSVTQGNGTSFAAPQVSGVYAALKKAYPGITVAKASAWIASACGSIPVPVAQLNGTIYRRLRVDPTQSCPAVY